MCIGLLKKKKKKKCSAVHLMEGKWFEMIKPWGKVKMTKCLLLFLVMMPVYQKQISLIS